MTQEEKTLKVKDLCGRLPYGVILHDEYCKKDYKLNSIDANGFINYDIANSITHVKPYLRPMSSMTEEEKEEYCNLQDRFLLSSKYLVTDAHEIFDWLNAHHFDYRGLVEKGLALEAPKNIYNIKTE